jgi:hypothetical protein
MNLSSYPKPMQEAVCAWLALRRLGFSPDDIYFMVGGKTPYGYQIIIVLRAQKKEFLIVTGAWMMEPDVIGKKWIEIAEALGKGEATDYQKTWESSRIRSLAPEFTIALKAKGFVFPITLN